MKLIRISLAAVILAVAAFTSGCGGGAPQGEKLEWSKIEDKSMDGKMVTIEGYPELPFLMYTSEGRSTVHLHQRMNQYGGGMITLSVKDGDDANTMKVLPDDYEQSDLVMNDNTGGTVVYGEKVKVTGKAKWEDGDYTIEVELIEKGSGSFDYAKECTRLTDDGFETLDQKLVWAEGEVYIADEQEGGIRMDMWLDDTTLAYEITVKLEYGSLPNQADELPETYYEDDVIFRDAKGKKLGEGSRVRVYGVWYSEQEMIAVEKIEAAE